MELQDFMVTHLKQLLLRANVAFLHASPSHETRHEHRLRKVQELEVDPPRPPGAANDG